MSRAKIGPLYLLYKGIGLFITNLEYMSQDNMIKFECTECKRVNYHSKKNKKVIKERLELKKFCSHCKKHVPHKETK